MTAGQYTRAILRRAWILVLLPVLAVAGAVAVTRAIPPVYESEVAVLVRPAQPISSLDPSSGPVSADQVSRTYAQLMTQRPLLEQVISDLKLDTTPEQLAKSVTVAPQANTTVLKVTVQNRKPVLARDIANKLVEDFVAQTNRIQQGQVDQYTAKVDGQLDQLRKQIQAEQTRIDQLQSQLNQAQPQPSPGRTQGNSGSAGRGLTPEEQSELAGLQQQVTLDRSQYFELVRNKSDIQLSVARAADSIVVVSPAAVPVGPSSPKLWLNALIAAFCGVALAVGLIVLLEHLDQSIKSDEQLTDRTGLLPLGNIPVASGGRKLKDLVVLHKDRSLAEPYKMLRTNILFSTLDRQLKTITVTSAAPREGKSRTSANLAISLAAAGHRTLLIDCDFRRPAQHRLFGRVKNVGLADLILGEVTENDVVQPAENVSNLWVLTSGTPPPNPSELLGSSRMRQLLTNLGDAFTHMVIDTPPVNAVADALVIASYTDATLVVVEHGRSRYPAVRSAREALDRVGARVLGAVLNKVSTRYSYGYYYSTHTANGKVAETFDSDDDSKSIAAAGASPEPRN